MVVIGNPKCEPSSYRKTYLRFYIIVIPLLLLVGLRLFRERLINMDCILSFSGDNSHSNTS